MLKGAEFIIELKNNDEFKPILIQGDHGFGKSTYANRLISEVYSFLNDGKPYWNTKFFESHLGFSPEEVIKEWMEKPEKDICYNWDDAGLWLHSLDFQDPFVKDVGKYMQVARTDWSCIIFTTINIDDISSKIRGLRNAIHVDITKEGSSQVQPFIRTAVGYIVRKTWKGRNWKDYQWKDRFNCHVPDYFYKWYKPIRDRYADIAKQQAYARLEERKLKDITVKVKKLKMKRDIEGYMNKNKKE